MSKFFLLILLILFLNYTTKFLFSSESMIIDYATSFIVLILSSLVVLKNKSNLILKIGLFLTVILFVFFSYLIPL